MNRRGFLRLMAPATTVAAIGGAMMVGAARSMQRDEARRALAEVSRRAKRGEYNDDGFEGWVDGPLAQLVALGLIEIKS